MKKNKNMSKCMKHVEDTKGMNHTEHTKGFSYYVKDDQLRAYNAWPIEKRLEWLFAVNILRKGLPSRVRNIQDKFRLE